MRQAHLRLDQRLSFITESERRDGMMFDLIACTELGPVTPGQPVVALRTIQDHRHAVMDRRDGVIRGAREDRAGAQIVPDRQQAREPQRPLVASAGEEMRLLGALGSGPLVVAARRDQAAAIAPCAAKTGLGRGVLDPRVDRAGAPVLQITLVPTRDQAPPGAGQLLSEEQVDLLRRLDVEPSREGRDLEIGELELGAAQVGIYETSAHGSKMTGLVPILQAAEEG